MKNLPLDMLAFIGGLFLYGIKSYVGKWMVTMSLKFGKWLLLRTEKDAKLYWHYFYKELIEQKNQRLR